MLTMTANEGQTNNIEGQSLCLIKLFYNLNSIFK